MRRALVLAVAALLPACGGNLTHSWKLDGSGSVTGALSSVSSVMGCSSTSAASAPREAPGLLCEEPSVQLSFTTRGEGSATVEVQQVRVRAADSGQLLGVRGVAKPQRWNGTAYVPWEQTLTGATAPLQVLYELTFPVSTSSGVLPIGAPGGAWGVRVEVDLLVNGVKGTVSFETLRYAPDVVS
jgi:hypothetical protein